MKPIAWRYLLVSTLVALGLACSSHQSPKAPAGEASPSHETSAAVGTMGGGESAPNPAHVDLALRTQAMAENGAPAYAQAVGFAESTAVRDLPPGASASDNASEAFDEEAAENRAVKHVVPSLRTSGTRPVDPVIQSVLGGPSVLGPPIVNVDGLNNTDNFNAFGGRVNPSDDNGDVGPNHYVQQINLLVRVYNKAGAPLGPPFKLSSLFAPLGGQCAIQDAGDPVVLYDPLADRWFLSQFAFASQTAPPYHECVAVSKTPDPTGAYYLYDFITPGNEFPDYPHIGVWPDAYYMMDHQFTNGGPFNGTGAFAFNRKKMLIGDPTAGFIYFNLNLATHPEAIGGGLFADLDGLTPPPVGRPGIFAYLTATDFGDPANGIRLFDFHADFAVPANSTFTEPATSYAAPLPVAAFSLVTPAGRRNIQQPAPAAGVTMGLDAITDRFLHRMPYRNFGGYESLVLNHTVCASGPCGTFGSFRAGVRYYELRRGLPGGNFAVQEQATHAPADGISRWMASAAMDHEGNIGVGFSVVRNTPALQPGINYAGRLASDPPGGLFQGEATLVAGTGVQTTTNNRWGDYSGMGVDPSDDCTFWFTDEYYTAASQATSTAGWLTRIGSFKVNPACTAPPKGRLAGTITYCDGGLPVPNALIEVSDGHSTPTVASGAYGIDLSPGNYMVTISGPSCTPIGPFNVTISNGATTTQNGCLSGSSNLVQGTKTITGGNGNGVIDANECNKLTVSLSNIGCAADSGITATLTTSTAGVTVDPTPVSYPNILPTGSAVNTPAFEVSTSPSFLCGTVVNFIMTTNSSSGVHNFPFSLRSCVKPTINISGSIGAGDPLQNGRLFRDGITSVCGSSKATPAITDGANTRRFDQYPFTNDGDVSACVTVNVTSGCGTNLFYAVYNGSFNPANIQQNYRADPGLSFAATATFSFDVPAHTTYVLAINEVAVPNTGCASYTGTISGLFTDTDGGGVCPILTELSPAHEWIGLKNSDDVGTNFDLKAEVYKNNTLIGSGESPNLSGGSSGFNNAKDRAVALALSQSNVSFLAGDKLSIKLYVKITAVGGHRSGTARLWFNDAQANTRFDATINGVNQNWYIRAGGGLETTPGAGPKTTIDVFCDRLVGGNPYKLFGTWTHTF